MPSQSSKVGEMLNKRTKNTKTWMNFDGSYTTEIHSGIVHFEDENGNLQNINTDLMDEADFDSIDIPVAREGKEKFEEAKTKAKADKAKNKLNRDNFDYQGLFVPFESKIPRNFKKGYTIGKGQNKLTFKPVGASSSKGYVEEGKKNEIQYQDAWNDTDVILEITPNGIKETMILKTDRAPLTFSFEVDGQIEDDLTAGELKLSPAWLEDANKERRDVSQTIRREGETTYIDLVADVTGLVYPIEIDPTVVIDSAKLTNDARINGGYDANLNDNVVEFGLPNNENRGLIRWDLSQFNGLVVSSATMNVYWVSNVTGSMIVGVHNITQTWSETTVKWSNQPTFESTPFLTTTIQATTSGQAGSFNVTEGVKAVANGGNYYGWLLKPQSGLVNKSFYSSEYTTNGLRPSLSVTYNEPPTAPTVTNPNGGETWNSTHTITWTASTDDGGASLLKYQIQLSTNNGGSWSDIVALTTAGATQYVHDFINAPQSSTSKIRIRAYDGSAYGPWDESDGVFSIIHNLAPTAPTNLTPITTKDRAGIIRFAWTHNDPNADTQSKFDLDYRLQGSSTWINVTQNTINQYYDLPAGTLSRGTYEWRIRTYDQADLSGPYSDIKTFLAGDKPARPTTLSPVDGSTVSVSMPTVQWSSVGQVGYTLKVLDATKTTTLWETTQTSNNKAHTIGYNLENGTNYTIQLTIKNSDGINSDVEESNIYVSYTPPAKALIAVVIDNSRGSIEVTIDNPVPIGAEPVVSSNDVYRKGPGQTEFVRVAVNVIGSFVDYTPAHGKTYEYYVKSFGENGTFRDSDAVSGSAVFESAQLALTSDYSKWVKMKKGASRNKDKSVERTLSEFAGRPQAMAEYGEHDKWMANVSFLIFDVEELNMLDYLIDSRETLLYRDNFGKREFVSVAGYSSEDHPSGWWNVSLTAEKVYFVEVI